LLTHRPERIAELLHRHEDEAAPASEKEAEKVLRTVGQAVGSALAPRGGGPRFYQYAQVKYWDTVLSPLYDIERGDKGPGTVNDRAQFSQAWLSKQSPEDLEAMQADFEASLKADKAASDELTAFFNLKDAVPGDQLDPEARLTYVASRSTLFSVLTADQATPRFCKGATALVSGVLAVSRSRHGSLDHCGPSSV
jgi:hypothetical protein